MKKIKSSITQIIKIIKSKNKPELKTLAINFLWLIAIICLIKIPIILARDFLLDFLIALENYSDKMLKIYDLTFNVLYGILIIINSIKFINKKYYQQSIDK